MSYLNRPRINLGGTFFTDPSTVNNNPSHYNEDVARPSPWQDPKGLHRFRFVDVKVQGAIDNQGNFVASDPVIGITANSTDQPSAAKIADLDVYQQGVPTIFGFQLQLSLSATVNIVGAMDPCCCNGLWWNRVLPTRGWGAFDGYTNAGFGGDTYACASYQSVLRIDPATWPASTGSVLDELRAATTSDANGNLLVSIRMVLDSYNNVPWHDDFNLGRVVATLGPVLPGELEHIPGGRWLDPYANEPQPGAPEATAPAWFWPSFYSAPFKFIQQSSGTPTLVLDMANAIAMQQVGGPPVPLGELTPYLGQGSSGPLGTFQVTQDLYNNLGGIVELTISQTQWQDQAKPLMLTTDRDDVGGIENLDGLGAMLWQENASGTVIDANDQVFRFPGYAGTTGTATVNITQFGQPMTGQTPNVLVQAVVNGPNGNGVQGASVPWQAGYPGDSPGAGAFLQATAGPIDQNGNCTITLAVQGDPGSRTSQLDGQLYFVLPYFGTAPDLFSVAPRQESLISAVVFSQFNVTPTWETVQAIMTPYVKLYPGMTDQIDLTQQQAFFTFSVGPPWALLDPNAPPYVLPNGTQICNGTIPFYMTRPFNDTRYMPVVRDLSPDKVLHVLTYIAQLQAGVQLPPCSQSTPKERS